MKMYDIVLDNGEMITVIAENINYALALAEFDGGVAIECTFIRNINKLRIEEAIVN